VLIVLLILPGGLASLVIKIRDRYVTLVVPDPTPTDATDIVSQTEPAQPDPTPADTQPVERSPV
jgi:hypothetical protein